MPQATTEIAALIHTVEAAFSDIRYPGDAALVYDTSGQHLECNEVAKAFQGKHWKEAPLELLRYHSSALLFFTPEAYRFYLPAYLLATVLHYDEADNIPGTVISSLLPPATPQELDIFRKRIDLLSAEQRGAIKSVLQFLKRHQPGDDPLGDIEVVLHSL